MGNLYASEDEGAAFCIRVNVVTDAYAGHEDN
jgi:hypothetical protein